MKYNQQWLCEKYNYGEPIKYLFFWGHQSAKDGSLSKSCFSQWWQSPFKVNQEVFETAEHWMMVQKARLFQDEASAQKILQVKSPAEAKKLGRSVKNFNSKTWDTYKFNIVVEGNFHKFSQDIALKEFLLTTNNRVIVEASPVDSIWGIGMASDHPDVENPMEWEGENLLGYALMEVRDRLLNFRQ
ncbi:NADAR family protein [Flectobacillus longus]|uniref:NADAR family protein n=1 Tax=Flectobacillus longus TaxID=2984207 RepID=UPI0024B7CEB5|nr:NADAR family protein [Flectobacillus longus]MDI9878022.1 NADAR family protein [Flectobacillus longus]